MPYRFHVLDGGRVTAFAGTGESREGGEEEELGEEKWIQRTIEGEGSE